jgi:hypothetical protein
MLGNKGLSKHFFFSFSVSNYDMQQHIFLVFFTFPKHKKGGKLGLTEGMSEAAC